MKFAQWWCHFDIFYLFQAEDKLKSRWWAFIAYRLCKMLRNSWWPFTTLDRGNLVFVQTSETLDTWYLHTLTLLYIDFHQTMHRHIWSISLSIFLFIYQWKFSQISIPSSWIINLWVDEKKIYVGNWKRMLVPIECFLCVIWWKSILAAQSINQSIERPFYRLSWSFYFYFPT